MQKAANVLSTLDQSPQPRTAKEVKAMKKREDALKPLIDAVVCGGLHQHGDKDVKLLVALCVTELFRIKAPEPPFEDKHLRVLVNYAYLTLIETRVCDCEGFFSFHFFLTFFLYKHICSLISGCI